MEQLNSKGFARNVLLIIIYGAIWHQIVSFTHKDWHVNFNLGFVTKYYQIQSLLKKKLQNVSLKKLVLETNGVIDEHKN